MQISFQSLSGLASALQPLADTHGCHEEEIGGRVGNGPSCHARDFEQAQIVRVDHTEQGANT
jgi:hypothetical protein